MDRRLLDADPSYQLSVEDCGGAGALCECRRGRILNSGVGTESDFMMLYARTDSVLTLLLVEMARDPKQ